MGLSRRHVIAGVVALVSVVVALAVIPSVRFLLGVVLFTRRWWKQASQGRAHLFLETDYQELLVACRSLSERTATGELRSGQYSVHLGKRDPETLSFPQVILDLKPACVIIDFHNPGEVVIELLPTPDWFGVMAFPDGQEGRGDVKLIDGLWYQHADYCDAYPEHMKWIDARIEEGRRRRKALQSPPASL